MDPRYTRHDKTLWLNERQVYRAACDCGVLSNEEFDELEEQYQFRDVVVHRFIISGTTYDQAAPRLDAYELVFARLQAQLEAIQQPAPPLSEIEIASVRARIARKLGGGGADEAVAP